MVYRERASAIVATLPNDFRRARNSTRTRCGPARLVRGQQVEILSAAEILSTLDADFTLDGLPFMPEMLKYCGQRMVVHRRVERTCVEGQGLRAMSDTVLLAGGYCDGASHDGCQRNCLLFWKEAWLAPVDRLAASTDAPDASPSVDRFRALALKTRDGERYLCQSTQLHRATRRLSKFNLITYFREIAHGELPVGRFLRIVGRVLQNRLRSLAGIAPIDVVRGRSGPHSKGGLDLRPGERVEVRSVAEISRTVGPAGRNRGLLFEPDMTAYVGRQFEVDYRIEKIISEETGRMVRLTNTVALKNVRCTGLCAKNCPRAQAHFWREAWLRRIAPADGATS